MMGYCVTSRTCNENVVICCGRAAAKGLVIVTFSTYREFVNLVSDDEGAVDVSLSPTPPPFSPLTPADEWY